MKQETYIIVNKNIEGNPIQQLTHGVTVGNEWMQQMIDGDNKKRTIWARLLQRRGEMGYPYIFFSDNANNGSADVYQDKKHPIYASNLCTEIMLPSNDDRSFVCVLSSVNLLHIRYYLPSGQQAKSH